MNDILCECLDVIEREMGTPNGFDESFRSSEAVLADLGQPNIANRLWGLAGSSGRTEALSSLLGILVWQTSDNGSEIHSTLDQWLRDADCEAKCWIALHSEVYVLWSLEEASPVLSIVSAKFPDLANDCARHIDFWRGHG